MEAIRVSFGDRLNETDARLSKEISELREKISSLGSAESLDSLERKVEARFSQLVAESPELQDVRETRLVERRREISAVARVLHLILSTVFTLEAASDYARRLMDHAAPGHPQPEVSSVRPYADGETLVELVFLSAKSRTDCRNCLFPISESGQRKPINFDDCQVRGRIPKPAFEMARDAELFSALRMLAVQKKVQTQELKINWSYEGCKDHRAILLGSTLLAEQPPRSSAVKISSNTPLLLQG